MPYHARYAEPHSAQSQQRRESRSVAGLVLHSSQIRPGGAYPKTFLTQSRNLILGTLLFLASLSTTMASLVREEVILNSTNICSIYYDTTKTNAPCRLMLFTHGLNQYPWALHTDTTTTNLIVALQTNGWVIAAAMGQDLDRGFGSGVDRVSHSNLVQYVLANKPGTVSKLNAVMGQSMGGLAAHYFVTNSGVTHGVFIYPICDLQWAYPAFGTADDSFGGAAYNTLGSGFDPMKFHVAQFNNKRLLYFHSFSDTGVNANSNTVPMVRKLPLARHVVTEGEHGDDSNFGEVAISNILAHLSDTNPVPNEYRVTWTPNVTVGVIGGPMAHSNLVPIACPTDGTDCSDAWQTAINAAASNDVLVVSSGRHVLTNALAITKSYITLRGAGATNTFVYTRGTMKVGADADNYLHTKTDLITNGATKGSYTVTLSNTPTFVAGDLLLFSGQVRADDRMQVYSMGSPAFEPFLQVLCVGVSGRTITLADPLPYTFTNASFAKLRTSTFKGIGIEDMTITGTNEFNGQVTTANYLVQFSCAVNSWITGCKVEWAVNYHIGALDSAHLTVSSNHVRKTISTEAGSNRAGLLLGSAHCLTENNIFSDRLVPAIEFNGAGYSAVFANFFTNNLSDVDEHGAHPIMILWEANHIAESELDGNGYYGGAWMLDGYFGSASHQTLFRNAITSYYTPVYLKRWSSYCAIVGNALGSARPGVVYTNFSHDYSGVPYQILELGRPNIGNNNFIGTNMPIPWNFPGHSNYTEVSQGVFFSAPNGVFVITNTQLGVTNLVGNFTNIPPGGALIFQDAANTNLYWPQDGKIAYVYGTPTETNCYISEYVGLDPATYGGNFSVSNGWRVFWVSSGNLVGYQQLSTTNRATHIVTGNYDHHNDAQTWDNVGSQTLPSSQVYTEAPSWWGTNRWPAIDPGAAAIVAPIPAQLRFSGIQSGGGGSPSNKTGRALRGRAGKVGRAQ